MTRKFFPEITETVRASQPHPRGTEYRISIGSEDWDGVFVPVIKVQIMYDGTVAGRKSPSYPVGTDDYERVHQAINKLLKNSQHLHRGTR